MAPTGTCAGQPNGDRMIRRRQVAFLDVVAGAGLADAAGQIDAEAVDDVARPAAAVALQFQRLFRRQNAAGPRAIGMEQEIAFFAEQPEAVADLPRNLHRGIRRALRRRRACAAAGAQRRFAPRAVQPRRQRAASSVHATIERM